MAVQEATAPTPTHTHPSLRPEIKKLLIQNGYDPTQLEKLGSGYLHEAYKHPARPEDTTDQVVKVPIPKNTTLVSAAIEEENHKLVAKHFPQATVDSRVIRSADDTTYVTVMDYVVGEDVPAKAITKPRHRRRGTPQTPIGEKVAHIIEQNAELIRQTGKSLDFVGVEGLWKAFGRLPIMPNIKIVQRGEQQELRIIDEDLLPFRRKATPNIRKRIQSRGSYIVNAVIVRTRFGLSLRGKNR